MRVNINTDYSALRRPEFYEQIRIGNKSIDGRFVIPSGIRCTKGSVIDKVFRNIPSVGIITTKSVSVHAKQGYREPVYVEYMPGSYLNAVGLENPGASVFRDELAKVNVPNNKFLLVSIFGGDIEEFVEAAQLLEKVADGFELNMSCPHVEGYGQEIGHDADLVSGVTRAVCSKVRVPVIVKLSATCENIGMNAKVAVGAGAAGISTINTVGPGLHYVGGYPTLSNKFGGLSGEAVRPLGLKSVDEIRQAIGQKPLVIGMGGISEAQHVRDYYASGADLFGIGSTLTNMDSEDVVQYFEMLQKDLLFEEESCRIFRNHHMKGNMNYVQCRLIKKEKYKDDLLKIVVDDPGNLIGHSESNGLFFFIHIPGVGEKPFSVFCPEEKSFIVRRVGRFTSALHELEIGSLLYVRGPYGKRLPKLSNKRIGLIGGGTGVIPLLQIADAYRHANQLEIFLGGKTKLDVFELDRFRRFGNVYMATEDGSLGHCGQITDLMQKELKNIVRRSDSWAFVSCGPEEMVRKCFEIQQKYTAKDLIFGSVEYQTSCGVGICGKCATQKGFLSCIDGPFMHLDCL